MKEQHRNSTRPNLWFRKGDTDLLSARLLFSARGPTDTICFLCQQAVEKYLKGYLLANRIVPRKAHDLVVLRSEATKPILSTAEGNLVS